MVESQEEPQSMRSAAPVVAEALRSHSVMLITAYDRSIEAQRIKRKTHCRLCSRLNGSDMTHLSPIFLHLLQGSSESVVALHRT